MSGDHTWDILLAGVVGHVVVQHAGRARQAADEDAVIRRGIAAAQVAEHLGHATPGQLQLIAEAQLVVDRRDAEARQQARSDAAFAVGLGALLLVVGVWAALGTGAGGWWIAAAVGGLMLLGGVAER
jgi:hypothetical protein